MASRGIKDRVAIIGMGCTRFGEHWDKGADDLLIDAAYDAYEALRPSYPVRNVIEIKLARIRERRAQRTRIEAR